MMQWRNRTPIFYVRAIIFVVAIVALVPGWGPPSWLLWSVIGMGVVAVGFLLYTWFTREV